MSTSSFRDTIGDVEPTLATLPPPRRAIVEQLKARGEASAVDLAEAIGVTVPAIRQQLRELEDDGLVAYRRKPDGRGRPTHCYGLTAAAASLFPQRYGDLAAELFGYLDQHQPDLVPDLFEQRRQRRTEGARERLAGKDLDERVHELGRILDEDGYLAGVERVDDTTWRIVERNCAILNIAARYGQACSSELAFLRDVLPDAEVERVTHIVAGAHNCGYEVRAKP